MLPKRPNREDSEYDLLLQQEEFLKQKGIKCKPNSLKTDSNHMSPKPENVSKQTINDIVNLNIKIVERDITNDPQYSMMIYINKNRTDSSNEAGFPIAPKFSTINEKPKRGLSLFAQQQLKNKNVCQDSSKIVERDLILDQPSIVSGIGLGSNSWKQDMEEIKIQNSARIKNMNKEEIELAREEIMKKLNPKTVAFLRSKSFRYRSDVISQPEDNLECNFLNNQPKSIDDLNITNDKLAISIEDVKMNKYPNMNVIEKDKLDWLGDIPKNNTANQNEKLSVDSFSARFNFDGDLVDFNHCDQIDVHEGLHHHGEEPDRPGYTVNELFMYLQSSYPAQKQIGLKVFEKIIDKAYQGLYDECFNANLIEYLLKDTPLVLVVRSCCDDSAETVWKSSISTMKAIVCNTIYDEMFLDRGFLILEDFLDLGFKIELNLKPIIDKEVEIDEQVPDQQYLMYDLISCLLNRTSILQRFAYLIQSNLLNEDDLVIIANILDILIRMGRHSKEAAEMILSSNELMNALLTHVIKKNIPLNQCHLIHSKSFKLIRVCISSISKSFIMGQTLTSSLNRLFNWFNDNSFIDSLNMSMGFNPEDVAQEKARILLLICIESLRTWLQLLSLIKYNLRHRFFDQLKGNFSQMFSSLSRILTFCKGLIPMDCHSDLRISSFDFQFASCIFALIKMYHEICQDSNEFIRIYSFDLYDVAMRWFTLIQNENIVPNFDTSICILVLTEFILEHLSDYIDGKFFNITFDKLFAQNDNFNRRLFSLCLNNSNTAYLRLEPSGTVRDSSNHPSFGSIYFKRSRSVPLFNNDSPICLLYSLIRIGTAYQHSNTINLEALHNRLCEYISRVTKNIGNVNFKANVFDSIEINIISEACHLIYTTVERDHPISDNISQTVLLFALFANKLKLNRVKSLLIEKIIFDHRMYPSLTSGSMKEKFNSIKQVYQKYSNISDNYWLFDPLLKQNSNSNDNINSQDLLSCLTFIDFIYRTFPVYFKQIGINNDIFFLMLMSVFLIDDTYFFDNDIRQLLEESLRRLLQSTDGITCSINQTIPKYGKCADFFNKVVVQFGNCSYGDPLFCNYLLVFFQQKCSPYFRNHFLSEHSFLLQYFPKTFNQLIVPIESLLFPLENDLQTLEIYLKTLLCELIQPEHSPILYCQMVHHLNHGLFREKTPSKQEHSGTDVFDKINFEKLISSVEKSQNQRLKKHIRSYSHFDEEYEYGIVLKD